MANLPDLFKRNRSVFSELFHDLDNFFGAGGSIGPQRSDWNTDTMNLNFDLEENETNYIVTFDVPGIRPEDLKIDISGNMLNVTGERQKERSEGKQIISKKYARVQQSIMLPSSTNIEDIKAHCENGALEIVIPKAKGTRIKNVEIQSGRGRREGNSQTLAQAPSTAKSEASKKEKSESARH